MAMSAATFPGRRSESPFTPTSSETSKTTPLQPLFA